MPPHGFTQTLSELYGDAAIPTPDWHLMKQLFARASAVVHEGGADQEMALWIWLGTREIAELVVQRRGIGCLD